MDIKLNLGRSNDSSQSSMHPKVMKRNLLVYRAKYASADRRQQNNSHDWLRRHVFNWPQPLKDEFLRQLKHHL